MARVLVTGASGFIGRQFVESLCKRGDEVACLVRPTSIIEPLQKRSARLVRGDVVEPSSLPAAVNDVDVVYHLAGLTKANTLSAYCRVNVAGVRNVVEACARRTTPPVVVLLSSLSAAGPMQDERLRDEDEPVQPISSYGRSKRAGELAAESLAGKVPITVLRPPVVFGPGDVAGLPLFRSIHKLGIHVMLGLGKRVSLVHVADLAQAAIDAAAHAERLPAPSGDGSDGESMRAEAGRGYYFVAAEEHPMYAELGRIVGRTVNRPNVKLIRIPRACIYALATWNELAGRVVGRPQYLNFDRLREIRGGHWICSPEKARRNWGYAPGAPLEQRLQQTAQWYRQAGWL
jgi:nucleoside-diphosphate-sugar epimerase